MCIESFSFSVWNCNFAENSILVDIHLYKLDMVTILTVSYKSIQLFITFYQQVEASTSRFFSKKIHFMENKNSSQVYFSLYATVFLYYIAFWVNAPRNFEWVLLSILDMFVYYAQI